MGLCYLYLVSSDLISIFLKFLFLGIPDDRGYFVSEIIFNQIAAKLYLSLWRVASGFNEKCEGGCSHRQLFGRNEFSYVAWQLMCSFQCLLLVDSNYMNLLVFDYKSF